MSKKGKLIIIEGGDGSGKATQTKLLVEHLQSLGNIVKSVSFPNYDSPAAMPVKMYLAGEFGKKATDVNPYVASTFYAVDRFASYRQDWQNFYENGGIILADRYTTSNMVHQMTKYEDVTERQKFLTWLEDLEYVKFGLPKPDLVCLLNVPLEVSEALMKDRKAKTGGKTGDIHELDREYLRRCHAAYKELINLYGWELVECTQEGQMRSVEEIHEMVFEKVKKII